MWDALGQCVAFAEYGILLELGGCATHLRNPALSDVACCVPCSLCGQQELEQRLKEADAAAAAAQAEHCDAVWLKGQAEGLRGLNEALQCQLEELGQELELRTQQVEDLQLLLQRWAGLP